jgi:hypothetical protein
MWRTLKGRLICLMICCCSAIKELLLKEGKEAIKQVQELAEKNGVDFDGAVVEGNPSDEIISYAKKKGGKCNHRRRCGTHWP